MLVLGRASDSLQRALESIPALHVRPPSTVPADGRQNNPPDLTVLVGSLPAQLPPGPLLLVDPPSTSARLLGVGLGNGARVQEAHPLLQGLDLAALEGETPSVGGVPGWAHVVLGTVQGPLVMEGKLEGRPVVALTFDPRVSGLEKSLAFPLLISNATSYLLVQAEAASSPGAAAEPFDAGESDITPRPIPGFSSPSRRGEGSVSARMLWSTDNHPRRPLILRRDRGWQWLAAGALVVLGAEWLVFARRG